MEINDSIKIIRTNSKNEDFKKLIRLLDHDLWERNGEEQAEYHKGNKIDYLDTVIIAYSANQPIACGCFREYQDSIAEIKRMFVQKSQRGKGISKVILKELELWASEKGYKSTLLETGKLQIEAINLYFSNGYKKINNYGRYKNLENSICFKKKIL